MAAAGEVAAMAAGSGEEKMRRKKIKPCNRVANGAVNPSTLNDGLVSPGLKAEPDSISKEDACRLAMMANQQGLDGNQLRGVTLIPNYDAGADRSVNFLFSFDTRCKGGTDS